jgi:fucose permease
VAAAGHVDVPVHFVAVAVVTGVAGFFAYGAMLPAGTDRHPRDVSSRTRAWSFDPVVRLLGGVALAGFVVEAAVADWAAVYLHENLATSAAVAAAGYATFAAVHLTVRFLGDSILTRVGRTTVMQIGCLLAAAGYALLLGLHRPATAFVGLAVIGAGIAAVVPAAFGNAGRLTETPSATGVATVTGISYVGWAAAPPLIGILAGQFGLRAALLLPLAMAVFGAWCAHALRGRVTLNAHDNTYPTTPSSR